MSTPGLLRIIQCKSLSLCVIFISERASRTADKDIVIADGEKGLLITAPDIKTDLPDIRTDSSDIKTDSTLGVQPEITTEADIEARGEETVSGMNESLFRCSVTVNTSLFVIVHG